MGLGHAVRKSGVKKALKCKRCKNKIVLYGVVFIRKDRKYCTDCAYWIQREKQKESVLKKKATLNS